MTILFSFHSQQQNHFSFCERVISLLHDGQHQIKILGAPETNLKHFANVKFFDPTDFQSIDVVLTYTLQGLHQVNDLKNSPNAPIIHLVDAENLEEEYPADIVPVSKIIVVGNRHVELFQSELVTSLFLPPVSAVAKSAPATETENKKPKILVDIKTVYTNGYALVYQLAPLFNALVGSEIVVFYDGKPLLPLFNKNVSFIDRREAGIEKLLFESDLIIGSGETIYKGIALEKPCIVVGEQGYGGIVTPQNFDWQLKANFQGRIGGYLNEHIPVALLTNDIQKTIPFAFTNITPKELPESAGENNEPVKKPVTDNTAKEKQEQEIREIKELLGKAFDETKEQWNNCLSTVIQQYKQRKNNLRNTKIKLSDTFVLIEFPNDKFVLTCQPTRKVHSDFGKAEADIINAFQEGCVVQDALSNSGYADDADMFLEFINMLLDEKILVIDE